MSNIRVSITLGGGILDLLEQHRGELPVQDVVEMALVVLAAKLGDKDEAIKKAIKELEGEEGVKIQFFRLLRYYGEGEAMRYLQLVTSPSYLKLCEKCGEPGKTDRNSKWTKNVLFCKFCGHITRFSEAIAND